MLIVLDESLIGINNNDIPRISALESILAASYFGEHFLTTSFPTVRALLALPLSLRGKAALHRLRSNISRHGHLPYPDSFVIVIVFDGSTQQHSANQWSIPIASFANRAFPRSVVLGENMLDAQAYISSSKQSRSKNKMREKCDALADAGGGSQISVKLLEYLNNNAGFCMCITDGDYREPQGTKSAVTSTCEKHVAASSWPAHVTDFKARAIENLIPLDLIEDSYDGKPIPTEFQTFKNISNVDQDTVTFIDAKVGLTYCDVKAMNPASPTYTFWHSKIVKHGLKNSLDTFKKNDVQCGKGNCGKCTLISGIGSGTLKRVVDYFNKNNPPKLAERVDINSAWCELGKKIFHWTMSDDRILS